MFFILDEDEEDKEEKYEENVFRQEFLELPVKELLRLNFSLHLLTRSPEDSDFKYTCEILLLILKNHRNVEENYELSHLDIENLVVEREACTIFKTWFASVDRIDMKGLLNTKVGMYTYICMYIEIDVLMLLFYTILLF